MPLSECWHLFFPVASLLRRFVRLDGAVPSLLDGMDFGGEEMIKPTVPGGFCYAYPERLVSRIAVRRTVAPGATRVSMSRVMNLYGFDTNLLDA
jgi:hypothetical protein